MVSKGVDQGIRERTVEILHSARMLDMLRVFLLVPEHFGEASEGPLHARCLLWRGKSP